MNTESLQKTSEIREPDHEDKHKELLFRIARNILSFFIRHRLIVIILVISFFLRWSLYRGIAPNYFGDSDSYDRGAVSLLQGNSLWSSYPRTPAYPAYLAFVYKLAGIKNRKAVVISQLFILGLLNIMTLYALGVRITGNKIIGALVALSFNLDFIIIQFDFAILTESLSGFLLLLSILMLVKSAQERNLKWTIPSGIVMGITAIVRPAFAPMLAPVFLFFLLGLVFQSKSGMEWKRIVIHSSIYVALSVLPCFIWLKGNQSRGNGFSFSPFMMNAGLTNHVGLYFEKLPDEYAAIRDPYVNIRNERLTTIGGYYRAREKMFSGAQGLGIKTDKEFEKFMTKLCLRLIWDNPKLYWKTFWIAWDMMWANRFLMYFQPPESKESTENLSRLQKKIFWGFWIKNVEAGILQKNWFNKIQFKLFLISAILSSILLWRERRRLMETLLVCAIVLTLSITTNALELSENMRYRVPFQPLVVLICVCGAGLIFIYGARLIFFRKRMDEKPSPKSTSGKRKKSKRATF
ncbi:glycosyltransferase family 39 protein [Candidatus Sumerlaeota bacterium]|nr:glycosyltransferase family 39 protein [Candidatus Sumerlaeota bacterium]